ncbi:MAG: ABC transporter substrate-binding protein [Candidatus Nanoarchaeia archaeon]
MRKIVVILLLAILLLGCKPETTSVKVGFMGPLSGDAASYGESIKKGVELAQERYGADIEIVYADSKCEGKEAVSVVNKLITVNNVQAIIGDVCSGASLAAATIALENKVVMISPASTSPDLTEAGDYFFRVIPSDALQGVFAAELIYEAGHRKLALVYSNEEYGVGLTTKLGEKFEELGGEVVAREAHERGAVDHRTSIAKIEEVSPDAIYIASNSPDSAVAVLKQIEELGVESAVYGSEAFKSDSIIDSAGTAAEGLILTSVSEGTKDFMDRHSEKYGEGPGPFAAQGYDAYEALAMVVQKGAKNGEDIMKMLDAISFKGASGAIAFDENGEVPGNYDVFVVQDGAFVAQHEVKVGLPFTP